MGLSFRIKGGLSKNDLKRVQERYGNAGARNLVTDVDNFTDKETQRAANKSAGKAPVKTGALRDSIKRSKVNLGTMKREFGSDRDYATRQEYEHATKSGFIRTTVNELRKTYMEGLQEIIRHHTSSVTNK